VPLVLFGRELVLFRGSIILFGRELVLFRRELVLFRIIPIPKVAAILNPTKTKKTAF
jgi:hypothetical protein